jgi:type IX secretion system substrate protein
LLLLSLLPVILTLPRLPAGREQTVVLIQNTKAMKKILLLAATLITMTAKSQTSVYHPFPDSSALWNFQTSQMICNFGGTIDSYYSITISGDTLISGQVYHKLSTPFVQSIITGNCTPYIFSGYDGAIRQDTASRKVFFVPPSNNVEQLLYDFNLQIGDTVKGFIESFAFPPDTVQSIDSVLVGSDYRKRWNINACYNIQLIEGIGSTFGLIQLSPGCITDASDFTLTCFSQNGMTLYPDTTTNCVLITDVKNIYPEKYFQIVSPNPFTNELTVTTNSNELSQIILYDIASQKLLQQKFTNSISINTAQLSKGIYMYEVRNKNGVIKKGKVVKAGLRK